MKKILLIEDDLFYAKQVKQSLENRLGYEVDIVSSYEEYKKIANRLEQYSYVLLDLVLGDCDQCELIDDLIEKNKPIIVITSIESDDLFKKYNKKRVIDFILKRDMVRLEYLILKFQILDFLETSGVLIVEDSSTFQKFLERFFRIYYPYSTLYFADNVQSAKEILEKNQSIRLVIVDYMLKKGATGLDLVKHIREKFFYEDVGIIALTANEDDNTIARFLKSGANDFLKKSFHNFEFVCRIDNVVKSLTLFQKIKQLAVKDPLTNCYNRYYLYDMGEKLFETFERQNKPVSIALVDLDHFKKINDTYGHTAGDRVLQHFSQILQESVRGNDFVVRYGGEEFLLFLGGSSKEEALKIVENRIRKKVLKDTIEMDGKKLHYNFSSGIADEEEELEKLIQKADKKLYEAKKKRGVSVI